MEIEFQKTIIGRASGLACFSVDKRNNILAVSSNDGSMMIFSRFQELVYEWKGDNIKNLHFLQDYLVGVGDKCGLHIWNIKSSTQSFIYTFHSLQRDNGISISCVHVCNRLNNECISAKINAILLGDSDGGIEIVIINENQILKSHQIILDNSQPSRKKIDKILEVAYQNTIFTFLALANERLSKITCQVHWGINENSDIVSLCLEIDQILPINIDKHTIVNMCYVDEYRAILCMNDGKYMIFNCNECDNSQSYEKSLMFPYGPFPCKEIDKCLLSNFHGIQGQLFIFSGGMPAVTYRHLNALSIAAEDEIQICFTFNDAVQDFAVISHCSDGINEILVLTSCELISITHKNGIWESNNNTQLCPFSKNEITQISNIVELPNDDDIWRSSNIDGNISIQMFAVACNDNTVSVWCLGAKEYFLHETIDLKNYFKTKENQEPEKEIYWPIFKKCGIWKKPIQTKITITSMKLINNSSEMTFLLIITNEKSVFLFKILRHPEMTSCYKTWTYRHIAINNDQTSFDEINTEAGNRSNAVCLVTLITFSHQIDPFIFDFNIDGNIIYFSGTTGVGCVDINDGKHWFRPLEVLKKGSKSIKILRPTSMFLWQGNPDHFRLALGFNDGHIVIICFSFNENGIFNVDKKYETLEAIRDLEIIDLAIIKLKYKSFPNKGSPKNNGRLSLEESGSLGQPPNSTSDSNSTNIEINSICANSASISGTLDISDGSISRKYAVKKTEEKTFLFKCDSVSVKMIDYSKAKKKPKTKFKFKIHDYFRETSTKSPSRKKKSAKDPVPYIVESRIFQSRQAGEKWFCYLLLSDKSIVELLLPNVTTVRTIISNGQDLNMKMISMSVNVVITAENIHSNSQLIIMSDQKFKTNLLKENFREPPIVSQIAIPEENLTEESSQLDFMKEAKISLTSLR